MAGRVLVICLALPATASALHDALPPRMGDDERAPKAQIVRPPLLPAAALAAAALGANAASAASSGGRAGGRRVLYGRGTGSYRVGSEKYQPSPTKRCTSRSYTPFASWNPLFCLPVYFAPVPLEVTLTVLFIQLLLLTDELMQSSDAKKKPGAALCLQVACYCNDRTDSLYGRLQSVVRTADTQSYEGLQRLISDTCLAVLRSSEDWLAGRTTSYTRDILTKDIEASYNSLVFQERSKWDFGQERSTWDFGKETPQPTSDGQPTHMVATLVILLRKGRKLPQISSAANLREAILQLAAEVSVEDNLMGAQVLWAPEAPDYVMERDEMFFKFPELVTF